MESVTLAADTAEASPSDCALNKQEIRHIYEILMSTDRDDFDAWYANLDPWNRGIVFASQLKKQLSLDGFN